MLSHLLIMRHAKSSWADDSLTDHARPLNKRGQKSADIIARTLIAKGCAPDLIWCSSAERTKETATRIIRIIPGAQNVFHQPEFYMARAAKALELCSKVDEPIGKLMLLGHNPGWADLFEHFSGHPHRYPTGACGIFERKSQEADWLSREAWQFKDLLLPRELMAE